MTLIHFARKGQVSQLAPFLSHASLLAMYYACFEDSTLQALRLRQEKRRLDHELAVIKRDNPLIYTED